MTDGSGAAAGGTAKPVIFISYSHKDEPDKPSDGEVKWLSFVRTYLQPAVKDGIVELFVDEHLPGGAALNPEIERKLRSCDIFILLVSANSMASSYIVDTEIRITRERQANGGDVHFYPLLLTPTPKVSLDKLKDMIIRPRDAKPLSSFPLGERIQHMTNAADEIADIAAQIVSRKPAPAKRAPQPSYVHIIGLPETAYERLVGRDAELQILDDAWANRNINIVSLIAEGGAGKSALVNEWLKRMQADNYRGADAVLGWSFYSQGSKERATSAEGFLNRAIERLEIKIETTSASAKGEAIAEELMSRRVLLVLDGVEPLQHGPDAQQGELKDVGLRALLRRFASTSSEQPHGLIVLTSRLPVKNILHWESSTAPVRRVDEISDDAGAALLRDNGVWGTEKELKTAARDFGGHPLALGLLASLLKETQFGDVRYRDHIRAYFADHDNPRHDHAKRVMESYEKEWLRDQPILLAVMHIVGLFDRPANEGCVNALRKSPVIVGVTEHLVDLDEGQWARAISRLRDVRLLAPLDPSDPTALDAHSLVREWFGERIKQASEIGWREAHARLYEHLRDSTREGDKPTLEDLGPLYQAVMHGCKAGLYKLVLEKIVVNRIWRCTSTQKNEFYSVRHLGAFGTDLAMLAWFFDKPYETPVPVLNSIETSTVLGNASTLLRAQGRIVEAIAANKASLEIAVTIKEWSGAALVGHGLALLQVLVGDISNAIINANLAVEYANRAAQHFQIYSRLSGLAYSLHVSGKHAEARRLFVDAERRQKKHDKKHPLLFSQRGYQYCDFLLAAGSWAEVRVRSKKILRYTGAHFSLTDLALPHLSLGRASLGIALAGAANKNLNGKFRKDALLACDEFEAAIQSLRKAGLSENIAICLLARAIFRRSIGDWRGATRDLDEVDEIAEPGPMKLYLCDTALERTRLAFAQVEVFAPLNGMLESDNPSKPVVLEAGEIARLKDEAVKQLGIAADYIESCGYHRRDEELAGLQAVLRGEKKFAELPPRV